MGLWWLIRDHVPLSIYRVVLTFHLSTKTLLIEIYVICPRYQSLFIAFLKPEPIPRFHALTIFFLNSFSMSSQNSPNSVHFSSPEQVEKAATESNKAQPEEYKCNDEKEKKNTTCKARVKTSQNRTASSKSSLTKFQYLTATAQSIYF